MSYTDPQIGTLTLSGDPARFVATERVPISGLSMDFEPVQDLHGYDYPWPAGGGKNLFDGAQVYTNNTTNWVISWENETLVVEHKNSYTTGTPAIDLSLPAGTYCFSFVTGVASNISLYVNGSYSTTLP